MADERAHPTNDPRDELIRRSDEELARLRDELAQTGHERDRFKRERDRWKRERDRLKRQNERLTQLLGAARRAGFRQAAPFAKDRPQGRGGRPGRRAGRRYGRRARRPIPARVDATYEAPLPAACPGCGGAVALQRVTAQYQEDLPVVRPIVWRFDVAVGQCTQCGRRVQGRHPLQTSDAVGAANVYLGPSAVALIACLHKEVGMPLAKMAALLRERFGLTVTPGGLVQVLHRAARVAAPTYAALCAQIRGSPVVSPDETGWRVGAVRHWLWAFATPETTVYRICHGRGFDEAAEVLGADFDGVLVRDGWAPYRRFTAHFCDRPGHGPFPQFRVSESSDCGFREIVGVVADVKFAGLAAPTPGRTYATYWQEPQRVSSFVIKTDADPRRLEGVVRHAVLSIDGDRPLRSVRTLEEIVGTSIASERASTQLLTLLGGIALLLAAMGIYGVMAYVVAHRTREFGIRMTIGADRAALVKLVLRHGLTLATIGIVVGMAAAAALSRIMAGLLYEVAPTDFRTFVVVPVVLFCAAVAACWLPALRATRVDPLTTLRSE